MKTIITTLPIYDKLAKQCFQRTARVRQATDRPIGIVCPRHRLPSWQYNVEALVVGAVTRIDLVDETAALTDITTYFPTLSDSHVVGTDTYYKYDGDTLNYLMTAGIYYLKITHANGYVYYSEWFQVDCVYENLVTGWTNVGCKSATGSGTAINCEGTGYIYFNSFNIASEESIRIIFYLTVIVGNPPSADLYVNGVLIDTNTVTAGLNDIILTATYGGTAIIRLTTTGAGDHWAITETMVIREYSDKYLTINFHNDCDLYNILYHTGWTQSMWFESETMEMLFPQEEEGVKNGDGKFVRSFARQDKKYIARTKMMPDYMVDVFNRMKLHETIELIDLVGDEHEVYNLEVEHEWLDNDKYYARINLTFDYDEAFVVAGCCNDL